MAGRTTRASGRDSPIDSLQPQCEEIDDMEQTPTQIPQQGLSPPYTRGSIHGHNSETNGKDVPMANAPFAPMFQMPEPTYGPANPTFSTGLFGQTDFSKLVDEIKSQFIYNCATDLYVSIIKPQHGVGVDADMLKAFSEKVD